ncbi:hypothetical protein [Streptomyces platensis]|uniref:hypothetical protein n=1 Tax=Streptomyces platensis TaxID=58346 RepID=UPI001F1C9AFC|nr:hypothetical protein [Streptomyces platensis]MCF3142203.1 hypothetical protein [Streptomyces platensis]
MSRLRVTLAAALVGMVALTGCSSNGDESSSTSGAPEGGKSVSSPTPKPISKELAQADLTQALLGDGETLPGWALHGDKSVTKGEYCNGTEDDSSPKGWVRGGDAAYEYNGSTIHMAFVHICLFDTAEHAHNAYASWKGTEKSKERAPKTPVGDESTLVVNPGASEDNVNGFSRSGKANIRVRLDGVTGADPAGAQAMLAATLKRLQQLQDGKPATVTATEEQTTARR